MMESLGQLLMTGIEGKVLTSEEKEFLEKENIGGVILFTRNYESPLQLAELVNSIQALRQDYPLFISVDNEGGRVFRFKTDFTHFPAMRKVAAKDSPKLCFEVHKIIAHELRACGVNLDFSPVCDVLTNEENKVIGDRAFHTDPEEVAKFVSAAIRGLQANGVLACGKHFPGHGGTLEDSHFDLPMVQTSVEDMREKEWIPFVRASKARVEFMMMAHLLVNSIDKDYPCSLSPQAYQLLREELKYQKLIITDDMEMKAIADHFSIAEAAVLALKAGADIILYQSMKNAQLALESVKEAVRVKRIKNDEIKLKLERIEDCKKRNLADYRPIPLDKLTQDFRSKEMKLFIENLIKEIG